MEVLVEAIQRRRANERRTHRLEEQTGHGQGEGRGHTAEPMRARGQLRSPLPDPNLGNQGPLGGHDRTGGRFGSGPPPPPPPGDSGSSSDDSGSSSSSSSSSSDSDADDEGHGGRKSRKIKKLKKKLKALKRRGRGQLPHRLDVKPFEGKPDDFKRFTMELESSFDQHRRALRRDMDKIRLVVPLLEGDAKKWYESVHHFINKHAAMRAGVPFDKNSSYRRWHIFFELLRSTFGGSLTRDKSVLEWNRLRHREGQIDKFLDRISTLQWLTGYAGEVVKDKIKEGLTEEMRKEWARVQPKPESLPQYMASLRAMAHEIEQNADYSKMRSRGENSEPVPKKGKGKGRERRERQEQPAKPQSQPGPSKPKGQSTFKNKDTELRGIPEAIREERRKASVCLKCGKSGHSWYKCFSRTPVTHSVNRAGKDSKRKRDNDKGDKPEEKPKAKKAKVERLQAAKRESSPQPRIKTVSPEPELFDVEMSDDVASIA